VTTPVRQQDHGRCRKSSTTPFELATCTELPRQATGRSSTARPRSVSTNDAFENPGGEAEDRQASLRQRNHPLRVEVCDDGNRRKPLPRQVHQRLGEDLEPGLVRWGRHPPVPLGWSLPKHLIGEGRELVAKVARAGRERQRKTLRDLGDARNKSREVGEERESHDPYL